MKLERGDGEKKTRVAEECRLERARMLQSKDLHAFLIAECRLEGCD